MRLQCLGGRGLLLTILRLPVKRIFLLLLIISDYFDKDVLNVPRLMPLAVAAHQCLLENEE